ncbi:ALP1-like protein [Tanacetum coccineum]
MLKKFGLEDSKPMKTPMSMETKLTKDTEDELVDNTKYRGTTYLGLWYPKGFGIETIVYADSDHAADYMDRKSTSGICTFMKYFLTSWFLKKQTALAISTTEADIVLHAQTPSSPQGDNQTQHLPPPSTSREMLIDDINQLQDLSNLLSMHLSQRITPSSPYSPNLPHTLNLNQVEQDVGYCPCVTYPWGYYLVDGIYPESATLFKRIPKLVDDDHKQILYKLKQESARKDAERAFGVLKKKWVILATPVRALKKERIMNMMYTCIILHNMIIKFKGVVISPIWFPEEAHHPDDLERSHEQVRQVMRWIRSAQAHQNL